MPDLPRDELVLLHLRDLGSGSGAATTAGISDALAVAETMSGQIGLLSTLSDLEEAGAVTKELADPDGATHRYHLAADGRDRAAAISARLEDATVTVGDDDPVSLERAATRLGLPSRAAVLARADAEGRMRAVQNAPDPDAFVDRAAVLESLADHLDAVGESGFRTVLVDGEGGIGKSSLAEAVLDRAAERGWTTLTGTAAVGAAVPYAPVRTALSDILPDGDVPLTDGTGITGDAGELDDRRRALFYEVTERLVTLADDAPVAIFLDDLHRADPGTVELVVHLASALEDVPVLVLAAARPTEGPADTPLERLVERVADDRLWTVRLEGFDLPATRELLTARLGTGAVPEEFVERVQAATGGNPLFVEETLRYLRETDRLDPDRELYPPADEEVPVAPAIRDDIEHRLSALDDGGRRVVEAAAVAGRTVRLPVLAHATDLGSAAVREYADLLDGAGVWTLEADDRVTFESTIFREAITEGLAAERRRALHERVAAAIEADADDTAVAAGRVAEHYRAAGCEQPAQAAFRRAGDHAIEVYAHEVAIEHYETALEIARGRGDDDAVLEVVHEIADVHRASGRYDEALRYFEYLRDRTDDPELLREASRKEAGMTSRRGDLEAARATAERGLAIGETEEPTPERSSLHGVLGWIAMLGGDTETATEQYERQLEMARAIGDDELIAHAQHTLGSIAVMNGDVAGAIERAEREIELMATVGKDFKLATAYSNLAVFHLRAGTLTEAWAALVRGRELAEESGDSVRTAVIVGNQGYCLERLGRWDEALEHHEECLRMARRLTLRRQVAFAFGYGGVVHCYRGDLETAREWLERSLQVGADLEHVRQLAMTHNQLALLETLVGNTEDAVEHAESARDLSTGVEPSWVAQAHLRLGTIARLRGEVDAALDHHETGRETAVDCGSAREVATNLLAGSLAKLVAGDLEAALGDAREALRRAEAMSEPRVIALAAIALARALTSDGDFDRADELLARARAVAADLEADLLTCQARLARGELAVARGESPADDFDDAAALAAEMGATVFEERIAAARAGASGADDAETPRR